MKDWKLLNQITTEISMSTYSHYLTDAFGIEPYNSELRPLYSPKKPWPLTVFTAQSTGPLYTGFEARSSSCTCVFTYSVGNVQQISSPPAIPPVHKRH